MRIRRNTNQRSSVKNTGHTSHETAVSKALCTIAVKHWATAGKRFGVLRYSKTQLKALLAAFTFEPPLSMPPLLLKRIISRKDTARRYVALTPTKWNKDEMRWEKWKYHSNEKYSNKKLLNRQLIQKEVEENPYISGWLTNSRSANSQSLSRYCLSL